MEYYSVIKKRTTDLYINGSQTKATKQKTQDYVLYDSVYVKFQASPTIVTEKKLRVRSEDLRQSDMRKYFCQNVYLKQVNVLLYRNYIKIF